MKRNQVNAILVDELKRRKTIFSYACFIVILSILSVTFVLLYLSNSKAKFVSYNENSNIDYSVYLKENEYFDKDYLEKNQQYIASLIDYIDAKFDYKLSLDQEDVSYKYSYRIEAETSVVDKDTKNPLYIKAETLIENKEFNTDDKFVNVNENIKIDYNHFNNLISNFVDDYNLENISSTLKIKMYVNVLGSCEDFADTAASDNESVMTLEIPLTTRTVAIDFANDLVNTDYNVMLCESPSPFNMLFLLIGFMMFLFDILLIVKIVKFEIKTRSAENIYDRELKKILNNYRSYIQKVNNQFDVKGYQPMKIDTFTDLLEIRDTIQQPILMVEQVNKKGVYFIIPSNTKILYMYGLKISDIKKQMEDEIING